MDKKQQLKEEIQKEVKRIITEAKKKKSMKLEGLSVEGSGHVELDEVGRFWVTTEASKGSTDENTVFETDVFNFNEMISNGKLKRESVKGIFRKESAARGLAERFLQERQNAVQEAANKAKALKEKVSALKNELAEFKNMKTETASAVKAIDEKKKVEDKKKKVVKKPEVKKAKNANPFVKKDKKK